MDFFDRMGWFKENALARRLILLANLGGIAYGFYYYVPQFRVTPGHLWLFVPDSPLAVLWATIPLVLYEFGRRRNSLLDSLAFVANVQVGLWTGYVLTAYATEFRTFDFSNGPTLNFVLLWLHLGMAVEALVFVKDLRRDFHGRPAVAFRTLGIVGGWVLFNDAMDYLATGLGTGNGCGLRPYTVPCHLDGPEQLLTWVTFGLTLASVGALAVVTRAGAPLTGPAGAAEPEP